MPPPSDPRTALPRLFDQAGKDGGTALAAHLRKHSHLPGPRGNLELAEAFAALIHERIGADAAAARALWALSQKWAALSPEEAPVNDAREFLVFCAARAMGAFAARPATAAAAWRLLRTLAADPRWRTREGVAMAVQDLLTRSPARAHRGLEKWAKRRGEWLLLRAVAASVAEPALLREPAQQTAAFALHRAVLEQFSTARERTSPDFRTLRQGLGYSLSVLTAADPERGWPLLEGLAGRGDPDLDWVLRENLKKNRLVKAFPKQVAALRKRLTAHGGPH